MGIMGASKPFFARIGSLYPDNDQPGDGIPIPEGWTSDYWLGRVVWAGLCSYTDLCDGSLNMNDLMDLHRSLNLRDYLERKAQEESAEK